MEGIKNLKPFKKGECGNPKGRPRTVLKMPDIQQALTRVLGGEEGIQTGLDSLLDALYKKALQGDTKAAEILLARGFGNIKSSIELNDVTKTPRPIVVQTPEAAELVRKMQEGTIGTD